MSQSACSPNSGPGQDVVALLDDLQPASRLKPVALDVDIYPRLHCSGRVSQKHDVRFESLGLVQVHQPHDVRTPRLEWERLDFTCRLAVCFERISSIREAAAGFDDLAHTVDGMKHVTRVHATGRRRRESEVSAGFEDPFERAGRGEHTGPAVVVIQGVERDTDTVGRLTLLRRRIEKC